MTIPPVEPRKEFFVAVVHRLCVKSLVFLAKIYEHVEIVMATVRQGCRMVCCVIAEGLELSHRLAELGVTNSYSSSGSSSGDGGDHVSGGAIVLV